MARRGIRIHSSPITRPSPRECLPIYDPGNISFACSLLVSYSLHSSGERTSLTGTHSSSFRRSSANLSLLQPDPRSRIWKRISRRLRLFHSSRVGGRIRQGQYLGFPRSLRRKHISSRQTHRFLHHRRPSNRSRTHLQCHSKPKLQQRARVRQSYLDSNSTWNCSIGDSASRRLQANRTTSTHNEET